MSVHIELGGGVETLFGGQKNLCVKMDLTTVGDLLMHLADKYVIRDKHLFMIENQLRPGILVLVNDADWELEGKGMRVLDHGDTVSIISTLHGG